jgi:glycosyltransferase involved in cell wall biosynthesis
MRDPDRAERFGGKYFREVLGNVIREVDHLIAVSHATKRDLMEVFAVSPERITVVHHGVEPSFFEAPGCDFASLARKHGIRSPYFLSVGTIEPRKNYPFLIDAFDHWRRMSNRDDVLVIVGRRGWGMDEVRKAMQHTGADTWIRVLGYVSQTELHALYSNATALLFPSLYEGFGLPALEAMAIGLPVIASDTSALAEVLGEAGLLFPVNHREALLQRLTYVVEEEEQVRSRVSAGKTRPLHGWKRLHGRIESTPRF